VGLLTQYLAYAKVRQRQVWNERIKPKFPPFSALGVVLIAFFGHGAEGQKHHCQSGDILTILLPCRCSTW
jgi:ACR3 family arsenite transporter